MRIDLHMHSTASDGACAPEEVVRRAAEAGLQMISLTDHDTVNGVAAAQTVGDDLGVRVLPGIEVSSTWDDVDIHVLGYGVDLRSGRMVSNSERAGQRREDRMQEMVELLQESGVEVEMDDVLRAAGPERSSIGRPHLARALVEREEVSSIYQAFDRYIGDGMPAHVPIRLMDPFEAVELILESGGVPVWAHPPLDKLDRLLPRMANRGLRGLEVYRPRNRPEDIRILERKAGNKDLFRTGGSDWHGPDRGLVLGDFWVDDVRIADFLEAVDS